MAFLPRRASLAIVAIAATGVPLMSAVPANASALGTPGSLSPNSGTTEHKDAVLSWKDVAGASGYQVEMSRSDDFSDSSEMVPLADSGNTSVASLPVPPTLLPGAYYWRVRARNGSASSGWSAAAQVDKAWDDAPSTTGSTPGSDATVAPANIDSAPWRFAWTAIPDASTYEIELSTVDTFPQPGTVQSGKKIDGAVTAECLTTATSFTPSTDDNPPVEDVNDGGGCDLSSFDPGKSTVYWRVRGIDDSATDLVKATNQVNDLECFGATVDDNSSAGTSADLDSPSSASQLCSNWSSEGSVGYFSAADGSATTPGTVSNVTLGCHAGTTSDYACTTTPEISWDPVPNVAQYVVTIADDASFKNIERIYDTPFLSVTPISQLADYTAGKGYYVGVQSCTATACGTATVVTFTKRTPTVTGLTATKVQGGVRLSWNDLESRFDATAAGDPAAEAEDYEVQVTKATDPGFNSPIASLSSTVDASCDSTVLTCYDPPAHDAAGSDEVTVVPTASGSYIWRVLPVDETGNVLPAAVDTHAFTVDVTRPTLSITNKSGIALTGSINIKASEPVTGVSASTVHIVAKGKSGNVAGTLHQGATPTIWVFRPSKPLVTGETYVLSVGASVQDQSGNSAVVAGKGVRTTTVAKDTSKGWSYSRGWHKHTASGARSGSYQQGSAGDTASVVLVGSEVKLYGCKAPNMGKVKVTVGGHTTTVSEHQSFTRCGVELFHKALPKGEQTLKVTVASGKGTVDEAVVS